MRYFKLHIKTLMTEIIEYFHKKKPAHPKLDGRLRTLELTFTLDVPLPSLSQVPLHCRCYIELMFPFSSISSCIFFVLVHQVRLQLQYRKPFQFQSFQTLNHRVHLRQLQMPVLLPFFCLNYYQFPNPPSSSIGWPTSNS